MKLFHMYSFNLIPQLIGFMKLKSTLNIELVVVVVMCDKVDDPKEM